MSSQAKRNRRNISSAKTANLAVSAEKTSATTGTGAVRDTNKNITSSIPNYPYLIKDLQWTGIVTSLIIAILIICFVLFR
jgi:VIT1/CCC1 family predicted Fe2+/Mn2+ transporter